jgi:hypothetical protein
VGDAKRTFAALDQRPLKKSATQLRSHGAASSFGGIKRLACESFFKQIAHAPNMGCEQQPCNLPVEQCSCSAAAKIRPHCGRVRRNWRPSGARSCPSWVAHRSCISSCIAALPEIENAVISDSYESLLHAAMNFSPFAVMIRQQCTTC